MCIITTFYTFLQENKHKGIKPSGCRYTSELKDMKITEEKVVKVVKDRIFSAAFHPCSSSLLMAAGDKWGKVGLWNLVSFAADGGILSDQQITMKGFCVIPALS